MSRALYNATIIPDVIRLIVQESGVTEEQALHSFYKSETAKALNDSETGLYGQSALFIFSQYLDEIS